ncbi:MAG: Asp-tRNA(Asn)/Glu-tRNA(Gln) amidotransferase subunit GatB [Candidatus Altiarchaeales archaeon]|nr:Asp-tRNA(Asn)/Glu-tRNA(Gln) amidotransferase subunit GatB [Candidatus Altiarchaeales archaeon]
MADDLDVKIGLEIHVPLKTSRKLFCDCPTNYYEVDQPNINTCPVCTGMPGSKPYPLNELAVESAVLISRLLECKIVEENIYLKRKHYDYPDLPSGYQRTSEPLGVDGVLEDVGVWEAHIEEDPGRYDPKTGRVDYNRSGVPLIEIVTAPEMTSPEQVRAFMRILLGLLRYSGRIVDVGGVLRADVNISIKGGAKVEIKNVNSVHGAFKALKYEIIRQKNMMRRGAQVTQETRGFDESNQITVSQRVKETAADYRYIPDPDIPPQRFMREYVDNLPLPETPSTRRKRLVEEYGVRLDFAKTIVSDKDLVDLFEQVSDDLDPNYVAAWFVREVLSQLNYRSVDVRQTKLDADILKNLLALISENKITEETGRKLLERVIDSGEDPKGIVESEGLSQISDEKLLAETVSQVLEENPKAVSDYRSGEKKAYNFLAGQVMRKMAGRADIKIVSKTLSKKLGDGP